MELRINCVRINHSRPVWLRSVYYGKTRLYKKKHILVQNKVKVKPHTFPRKSFEFFHNSRLIRQIQPNIFLKFRDLNRNWTQMACSPVRHLNHYTKLFSVLVWDYNWILFMHRWFCPIRLIHLIGRKSLHFETTRIYGICDRGVGLCLPPHRLQLLRNR